MYKKTKFEKASSVLVLRTTGVSNFLKGKLRDVMSDRRTEFLPGRDQFRLLWRFGALWWHLKMVQFSGNTMYISLQRLSKYISRPIRRQVKY